jgi:excisionase family DNA binding protein
MPAPRHVTASPLSSRCETLEPSLTFALHGALGSEVAPMKRRQPMMTKPISKVLTLSEVSEYLNVSPVTIYRLLRRRQIPAFRLAGNWRFNIEDLALWMESQSNKFEAGDRRKSQ